MQIECYLNRKYTGILGYDKTKGMFLIRHVRFSFNSKIKAVCFEEFYIYELLKQKIISLFDIQC